MIRNALLLGSSLGVLLLATAVQAQTTLAPAPAGPAVPQASATPQDDQVPVDTSNDVVVTGLRASLGKAADIKRTSDNVVDSIVADDIGKFPDPTVAAALQRVPGVQTTVGDNNEIVNPIIRGLGDILTTLDGREIFTGTGRGFAYQDLPAEALAGADVYKSSTANLIEGGVAGQIDLRLHRPFDFTGFTVAATGQAIYARNAGRVGPKLGLLASDRFDTGIGEMGLLADISYTWSPFNRPIAFNCDFRSGNEGPSGAAGVYAPTCVGGLNNEGAYERKQANVSWQWQASPGLQIYANALGTTYHAKWASIFLIDDVFGGTFSNVDKSSNCGSFQVNGAGFFDPNGNTEQLCLANSFTSTGHGGFTSTQAHDDRTEVVVVSGGAKYDQGPVMLDLDLSYQHSRVRDQNFILDVFKSGNGITTTVNAVNRDGGTNYTDTVNGLDNRANYALSPLNQDNIRDIGHEFAGKLDGHYAVGSWLDQIQFGLRYADHAARHQQSLGGTCGNVCGTLLTNVPFLPPIFLKQSQGIPSVDDGNGVFAPNQDLMRDPAIQDRLRQLYGLQTGFPDFTADRGFYADEKTYTGYLQARYAFPLGGSISVDGLIGGRYTHTTRYIAGAAFVTPAATAANPNPAPVLTPFSANTIDNNFLPNASARIKFGGGLQARFNYARTIARPAFGDLNPGLSYLISTNTLILPAGSGGNPNLKPQRSDGFDATLEYYFRKSSFLAVGGYYKNIKDRVISQSQVETINGFDYNITRPRNVGEVTLKGIEASGQLFLDELPGALGGLGLFGNFTLADSRVETRTDALYGRPLQGVSRYNFNIGPLYEKYGLTARVVYTYRSSYYDENYGGTTLRPAGTTLVLNGVRANGRLDATVGYALTRFLTVTLNGTNLTRSGYESYYGNPALPRDQRFDDSTYSIGFTAKF